MTAAAYVLMQELRSGLAGTASARAQVSTLRERFLNSEPKWLRRCAESYCTCRSRFLIYIVSIASRCTWAHEVASRPAERRKVAGNFYSRHAMILVSPFQRKLCCTELPKCFRIKHSVSQKCSRGQVGSYDRRKTEKLLTKSLFVNNVG